MDLASRPAVVLRQRRELGELFGFETRNQFETLGGDGAAIGFAAEQGSGFGALMLRSMLGHWRRFEIHVFDTSRQLVLVARHPWRFYFQRLDVETSDGRPLGGLQQRFAILAKRFDVEDADGNVVMTVSSPLWKPWTFPFQRRGVDAAFVRKKWSGLLRETVTDADNFQIEFSDPSLEEDERRLVLCAGLFIDLQYFERKAG